MPKVKIDHIISFSSEDSVHVANNVLSSDSSKKWKCQTPGEKNAVIVLQLEKASVISGIDIGNEHSAYVEILVSRSGTNEDYKVLLVTSSFMTPIESRQSQNVNKVRMFSKDHFSKPICDEKWDRVKVVCSQPFNKHVQYGLSFINIHTTDDQNAIPKQTHIGKFVLRPESPDDLSIGSLFEKQKRQKQEEKLTGAAAIREASSLASLALYGSPVCKPKLKTENSPSTSHSSNKKESDNNSEGTPKRRDRNELLYSKDEEEPNDKIDKIMEKKIKEAKEEELKLEKEKKGKKKAKPDEEKASNKKENGKQSPKPQTPSSSSKDRNSTNEINRKRKTTEKERKTSEKKKMKKDTFTKPFGQLLEGVTLVISGIQNPDRGILRAQALSMGAKYKPDWDNSCTHLICAFPNTPKFNQVRGKGKIVKRKWLDDCHSQRTRLPWRRYALDKNDVGKEESEDEIYERIATPPRLASPSPLHSRDQVSGSDTDYDAQNDAASDTEERIARIQELQKVKEKETKRQTETDIYSVDTDEESPTQQTSFDITDKLENIFENKKFYIDESFDSQVYNKLLKYITAYNGNSLDSPTDGVDVIITSKENSKSFKEMNSSVLCLGPEWIWNCHNSQKLVPIDEYVY